MGTSLQYQYPLVLTFFGLTPSYRNQVFTQIHDLVYHGGGGFLHSEVYNMPIWMRRYHIQKINEYKVLELEDDSWENVRKKRDYLLKFNNMKQTELEIIESIDMNRIIENGEKIKMEYSDDESISVDTKSDLD